MASLSVISQKIIYEGGNALDGARMSMSIEGRAYQVSENSSGRNIL